MGAAFFVRHARNCQVDQYQSGTLHRVAWCDNVHGGVAIMDRKINVTQHGSTGVLWCIGWLFTIGFLKLGFWNGVLALIIWPYYLGAHLTGIIG